MYKRLFLTTLAAGLLSATALPGALAQDGFPSRNVRWIVPYAAGGGSDFLARTIGQAWGGQVHQPIVVDNRPGGNTAIGASETARAAADGYTVLSADNGTLVFNPVLYKSLSYNPARDLAPVTLMGRFPMILVAGPGMAAATAKDFLAQARTSKDGVNYASAGAGSPHHLAMELLRVEAGLKLVHAPYKGAAPALGDVAGGQVPVMMVDLAAGAGFIKGGKVRPLAVANATRLPQLPDVPTVAEQGFPGFEMTQWYGMLAPSSMTRAHVDKLAAECAKAVKAPDALKRLQGDAAEPIGSTPQQFAQFIATEQTRWQKVLKRAQVKPD